MSSGRMCIKLVSTIKENSGRLFFGCPIPRVDRTSFQSGSSSVHSGGRFEAFELVLKEKNEQIAQLELENEQISKELFEEKLHTRCLRKYLKDTIIVVILCIIIHYLYHEELVQIH
ncbi:hypothetical protein LIER_04114 [Lithospermum erythrorhizon]|uniref:Uncharacterized protein n=1 Tax=Lithospermum erythrorhizon TaxID=34254 RepID=A0AAV3NXH5_LITER